MKMKFKIINTFPITNYRQRINSIVVLEPIFKRIIVNITPLQLPG